MEPNAILRPMIKNFVFLDVNKTDGRNSRIEIRVEQLPEAVKN